MTSKASVTLADQIERTGHALTADNLARVLSVSRITVFKMAKATSKAANGDQFKSGQRKWSGTRLFYAASS
jgi:hypothetical protein